MHWFLSGYVVLSHTYFIEFQYYTLMALLKLLYYQTIEVGISKGGGESRREFGSQKYSNSNPCQVGKDKKFDFTPVH